MSASRDLTGRHAASDAFTTRHTDPILEDLRQFAEEIGLIGFSTMTKEEIVESLRQRYVFDALLNRTDGIPKRGISGSRRH